MERNIQVDETIDYAKIFNDACKDANIEKRKVLNIDAMEANNPFNYGHCTLSALTPNRGKSKSQNKNESNKSFLSAIKGESRFFKIEQLATTKEKYIEQHSHAVTPDSTKPHICNH